MARVPGLEQRERRAVAHLSDDDAIGPQPHRALEQARHIDRVARVKRDGVLGGALDLGRVFENDKAVLRRVRDDRRDHGIGECGLARARAARHDDVQTRSDGIADDRELVGRHHALRHVILEIEQTRSPLSDCECGAPTTGGSKPSKR